MINSKSKLPLVSVLMPAYNHEKYIEQAIRSVWQQTYKNIELLIVDDGSTDSTLSILEIMTLSSPIHMQVITQVNRGVCSALNVCYEMSRGQWIATLASDDAYQPEFVERMMAEALCHPEGSTVLHCDAVTVDEAGFFGAKISQIRSLPPYCGDAFRKVVFGGGYMVPSTAFISRSLREKVGPYDESLKIEDFEYRIRLARCARFVYVDAPLFITRKVSGSLGSRRHIWSMEIFKVLEKHREWIGPEYDHLVSDKHAKFSEQFFLVFDVRNALRHLHHALQYTSRRKRLHTVFRVARGIIKGLPRALAMGLFPDHAVRLIRRYKNNRKSEN